MDKEGGNAEEKAKLMGKIKKLVEERVEQDKVSRLMSLYA